MVSRIVFPIRTVAVRMSVCGRRHGEVGFDPEALGVILIAYTSVLHFPAVDLQCGIGGDVGGIGSHIYTVVIGLSGFKSGDFVSINVAAPLRLCGNNAGILI